MFSEMSQNGYVREEYKRIETWLKNKGIDELKASSAEAESLFRKIELGVGSRHW